jgi:hypothetical protein
MSDRLTELRRQRALIQQHADWLDHEIAGLSGRPAAPTPPPAAPASSVSPDSPPVAYTADPVAAVRQVRRGCLLYLVAALALLGAMLLTIYLLHYRDRPLLFMERSSTVENR